VSRVNLRLLQWPWFEDLEEPEVARITSNEPCAKFENSLVAVSGSAAKEHCVSGCDGGNKSTSFESSGLSTPCSLGGSITPGSKSQPSSADSKVKTN